MSLRVIQTPQPPAEADLDTPDMVEAAAAVEWIEQDFLMLTEIGMDLARAPVVHNKRDQEAVGPSNKLRIA